MAEENEGKSILWVIGALMLAVLGGVWTFAAGDYYQNAGAGGGSVNMFANAAAQIPNAASVISYTMKTRAWLLIVLVVLEALVFGLGVVMKRVEKDLNGPARGKKKR